MVQGNAFEFADFAATDRENERTHLGNELGLDLGVEDMVPDDTPHNRICLLLEVFRRYVRGHSLLTKAYKNGILETLFTRRGFM